MRSIRTAAVLLVVFASSMPASQAQPSVYGSSGFAATATFRFGNTSAWFSLFDGTTGNADAVPLEYDTDTVVRACASMSSYRVVRYGYGYTYIGREDYGCGRLTATKDALMDVVRVRGNLRSYYTGSKMAIDLTFRSLTPPLPYFDGRYGYPRGVSLYPQIEDPEDSVGIYVGGSINGGIRREAQISGSMGSSIIPVRKRQGKGYIYQGAALSGGTTADDDYCC